jgi:hypothetical protein
MRKNTLAAAPALPTAERVKRNTPKVEDRAKETEMLDELLKQVIVEAKAFRRPQEHRER